MVIRIVLVQLSGPLEQQVRAELGAAADLTITEVFDSAIEAMLYTDDYEVAIGRMASEVPAFATTIVEKNPAAKVVLLRDGEGGWFLYERHPRLIRIGHNAEGTLADAIRGAVAAEAS